jgi:hypothetical protein
MFEKAKSLSENMGRGLVYVVENEEVFRLSLESESVGFTWERERLRSWSRRHVYEVEVFGALAMSEMEGAWAIRGIRRNQICLIHEL